MLSGDSIVVRGVPKGGPPPERTIALSHITAPKLGRRPAEGADVESQQRDEVSVTAADQFHFCPTDLHSLSAVRLGGEGISAQKAGRTGSDFLGRLQSADVQPRIRCRLPGKRSYLIDNLLFHTERLSVRLDPDQENVAESLVSEGLAEVRQNTNRPNE